MKSSICFLLAAVVSLHGIVFTEDDSNESSTAIVSQKRDERQQQSSIEQFFHSR